MKADFDEMKNVELIRLSLALSLSLASFSPILNSFFLPYFYLIEPLFPTFTV
jgi:hypothetical protein